MDCTNLVYALSEILKATAVFLIALAIFAPQLVNAVADRIRGN